MIKVICYRYWENQVIERARTEKAVCLEVTGDKRFVPVGAYAWFPLSALELETIDDFQVAKIKPWFLNKMTRNQAIVAGMEE